MTNLNYQGRGYSIFLILLILLLSECTDNFDNLNAREDKLTAESVDNSTLGQVFASSEYWSLVGDGAGWELMHELHASIYSQIFVTTSSGFDTDQYKEVESWVNSGWNAVYTGPARSINFVKEFTAEHNMPVENAVAKIMQVPIFARMTDFFGPIMFSEYGNGKTSVKYDSQKSIYYDFFSILDSAVTVLKQNTNTTPFGNNDIIYSGDVNKWILFANSLRLRLAMRIVYADEEKAKEEALKAIKAGVITNYQDNPLIATTPNNLNYLTRWTYINPFGMSATSESILKGFNDPRLSAFWNEGGGRLGGNLGYHGVRNGLPRSLKTSDLRNGSAGISFVSDRFLPIADGGPNPPIPVMTAAEVYFLRAEGALRGWDMGAAAEELYNEGMRQSLKYWTDISNNGINKYINSTNTPSPVPDGIINADFNTPAVSNITIKYQKSAGFETQLEQIITQKWIDSFLNPEEAWAERRRTGYPRGYAIIQSLNPDIPVTAIIRRMPFPPSEFSNNRTAVEDAISNLLNGPNNTMTRVWWDQKPLEDYPDLSNTVVPGY